MKELQQFTTEQLRKEILARTVIEGIPSHRLHAEIARRKEPVQKDVRSQQFVRHCAEFFDMTVSDLTGPGRPPRLADPRMVAMAAAYQHLGLIGREAALLFGRMDHGTAVHAAKRVKASPALRQQYLDLIQTWNTKQRKLRTLSTAETI